MMMKREVINKSRKENSSIILDGKIINKKNNKMSNNSGLSINKSFLTNNICNYGFSKKREISLFEIFLLIGMTFAFSYIVHQSSLNVNGKEIINEVKSDSRLKLYSILINLIFSKESLVSALDSTDLSKGAYTCVKSKSGKSCQEFPASECATQCDGICIPSPRKDVSECKLGTCYDSVEGTCQAGSPKATCEPKGGKWFDDVFGNIKECKQGCCILGDQTRFGSEQQCTRESSLFGIKKDFRPEVNTELACLILAKSQEEGACVFTSDFENTCKFTTKASCLGINGEFHSGLLCSNEQLKTNCVKQATTKCVDGRDEIYWFDSCGNRENIYDANKVKSFNDGKVLGKAQSCSLGNNLNNLGSCGNCNYLLGSICGAKTADEKLSDSTQEFVCKDLSCKDSSGQKRENGESWCSYNGAIGTDTGSGGKLRSVDTPGSRDFRRVCIDAGIRTEPCADFRNEICVESQTKKDGGGTFSSAACRINRWQQCLEYNTETAGKKGAALKTAQTVRDDRCSLNPDCFIKEVNVDEGFKFNICAPKYPAGFNLNTNGEGAENVCSLASQTCTAIFVKGIGGWECKANCNCLEKKFTEQMNDLCISLGDCGVKVNYQGDFGLNKDSKYVQKAPKLSASYLSSIAKYAEPVKGKIADPGDLKSFYGELGIPGGLGMAKTPEDRTAAMTNTIGLTAGMAGIVVLGAAYAAGTIGATSGFAASTTTIGVFKAGLFKMLGPQFGGITGALAGAAVGLAVVGLLLKFTGVGAGLDPIIVYSLMAAGAFSGAVIGTNILAGHALFGVLGLGFGFILAAIVIAVIVIFKLLGVGDTKKVKAVFSCQPWQPPLGGAKCNKCGGEGLPCSVYACQALGQRCEFINEGTSDEACIDISPDDASPPVIKINEKTLPANYQATESGSGATIKGTGGEECIRAYEQFTFGITLDEPGQCRFDTEHKSSFDDMEFDFGSRNLFLINHTQLFVIPSLESLGLAGYDPERRADYNLYVRCQDKSGNKNINEYAINFCVRPGKDLTAPLITRYEPQREFVRYDATSVDADVFVNEPAQCKYSVQDKDYASMENSLTCANDIEDQELYGWRCEGTLGITKEENKFYVRCKDQPWKAGNESERNTDTQSYVITYKRSKDNLKIDYIKPENGTIVAGVEPVSVAVEVKTSGGVDGKATCAYSIGNQYVDFLETLGTIHKQTFQSFLAGEVTLPIRCEDIAGNSAEQTAKFNIEIDTQAPKVTRVYNEGGSLVVITDEKADCGFVTNDKTACSFGLSDGNVTLMSGEELKHSGSLQGDFTHYVKCKDIFGNAPGSCNIIVKGGVY